MVVKTASMDAENTCWVSTVCKD